LKAFNELYNHFGKQNWWPAETDFEVIVGAILTQQTSWRNVEKAIANLKQKGMLSPFSLYEIKENELQELIRPVGFYKIKAKRLKNIINFLKNYNFDLDELKKKDIFKLRKELLEVNGVGKETADSIILYALHKPIFVIDNYTKRFAYRFGIVEEDSVDYDILRELFEISLKGEDDKETVDNYKEMHALIVELGKIFCKKNPNCILCPLKESCLKKGVSYEFSKNS